MQKKISEIVTRARTVCTLHIRVVKQLCDCWMVKDVYNLHPMYDVNHVISRMNLNDIVDDCSRIMFSNNLIRSLDAEYMAN